jgi:GNAT superfamily N-acetyltransferase
MFWSGYPWWKHLSSPTAFSSHAFPPPDPPPLPDGVQLRILTCSDVLGENDLLKRICVFLYDHFGKQPRLVFHPDTLLPPRDHLLVLHDPSTQILGTIRYHFIGHLYPPGSTPESPYPIHLVDAFCLHPHHRGKGWGAVLLATLHHYANRMGIPHALFLKEGPCLPVLPLPIYSGRYVYRSVACTNPKSPSPSVFPLRAPHAQKWIHLYRICQPQTLLLIHPIADAHWRVYRRDHRWVLACFQDTHQQWITPEGKERMGWCTVWLESPDLTAEQRQEVSLLLSDSVSAHFDWIWMNRQWTGGGAPWKEDGGFHWYTYQWTTNLSMRQSYALMG